MFNKGERNAMKRRDKYPSNPHEDETVDIGSSAQSAMTERPANCVKTFQ